MPATHQTSRGDRGIKKSQLKQLTDNYYEVMKKKNADGKIVNLDPTKDAKCVWFSKAAIDQLFADHGCTDGNNDEFGLRIYYTVHKKGILHPEHEIPDHYDNQQSLVLVATKKTAGRNVDMLKNDEQPEKGADGKGDIGIISDGGDGQGMNHGDLCPPGTGCD
jgi:hypothetical protein